MERKGKKNKMTKDEKKKYKKREEKGIGRNIDTGKKRSIFQGD